MLQVGAFHCNRLQLFHCGFEETMHRVEIGIYRDSDRPGKGAYKVIGQCVFEHFIILKPLF